MDTRVAMHPSKHNPRSAWIEVRSSEAPSHLCEEHCKDDGQGSGDTGVDEPGGDHVARLVGLDRIADAKGRDQATKQVVGVAAAFRRCYTVSAAKEQERRVRRSTAPGENTSTIV